MFDRRHLIKTAAAQTLIRPVRVSAETEGRKRVVLIILRGGQDSLHTLPPYGEPHYKKLRPRTTIASPNTEGGAFKLDGVFGLHPTLGEFGKLYRDGQMLAIPAIGTRYRGRSHFDGQNVLESGANRPFQYGDGFLNRALGGTQKDKDGLILSLQIPLVMLGKADIEQFSPSIYPTPDKDYLQRVVGMYEEDPLLREHAVRDDLMELTSDLSKQELRKVTGGRSMPLAAKIAARYLKRANGPSVAVLETGGFDTHNKIEARSGRLLKELDRTVATLKEGLGPTWADTVVMTVSEFGRTAKENGSRGTDHGTGGMSFLLGGAVAGGQIYGDWPGLRPQDLFQGRDIQPVTSTEGVMKAILAQHLGIAEGHIENEVFPDTRKIAQAEGLFRT
jgi:uncharacterized protein (DUF1501 family)